MLVPITSKSVKMAYVCGRVKLYNRIVATYRSIEGTSGGLLYM